MQSVAILRFEKGWRQSLSAPIQRGQSVEIHFDPERLPRCRRTIRDAAFIAATSSGRRRYHIVPRVRGGCTAPFQIV